MRSLALIPLGQTAVFGLLALGSEDPQRFFLSKARVALSPGPRFGQGGAGFARLNFATSRAILDQILERMAAALGR